ncbi:phage terminase small subunit-related protein, partial [Anaerobutyricum hallii]
MMPRKPDERIIQAKELYLKGLKLVEIASQLSLPEGTVRRWKSTYKWDNERSDKNSERSDKKKGG